MGVEGTLGALGFGNMGAAIVEGIIRNGVMPPGRIGAYDIAAPCLARAEALGVLPTGSVEELVAASDILLIAVKPQTFDAVAGPMASALRTNALLVSIMAGISLGAIEKACGGGALKVARVMPNLPAQVGLGAAGIALNAACGAAEAATVKALFDACGHSVLVPEEQIDAVTALSGSGPAYFFYLAECMAQAGMALGLSEADAERLAAQTLAGAGSLIAESGEPAGMLRARVTSRGGTTAAALEVFDAQGFDRVILQGMTAARDRARELGK